MTVKRMKKMKKVCNQRECLIIGTIPHLLIIDGTDQCIEGAAIPKKKNEKAKWAPAEVV